MDAPVATVPCTDDSSVAPKLGSVDVLHAPAPIPSRAVAGEGWTFCLLLSLAALLLFARLPCGLLEPEEARYAEIARQMLDQGRWLTPVLNGEDYLHKPPLLYWLIMLSYGVFGVHDWAARLVPCLAGIGVVAATYFWARATLGRSAAFRGALVLLLSSRFLYLQGMILFDGLLTLWVTLGWTFGFLALRSPRFSWPFLIASALACGLGILTKGPVAVVLVSPPLVFQYLRDGRKDRPSFLRLGAVYAATAGVLCLPWFLHLALQHPDAARDFFFLHHLQRYVDPFDHAKPWWFYLAPVTIGMLPWSLIALVRIGNPFASLFRGRAAMFWLTGAWCLFFFSLSGCKRHAYILPAFAPLAVALGFHLRRIRWLGTTVPAAVLSRRAGFLFATTFVVLFVGTLAWLPAYHARFGTREALAPLAQSPDLPTFSYPRSWDSLTFYSQAPVRTYDEPRRDTLFADLARHDQCWLILRRRDALDDFTRHCPANLTLQIQAPAHSNIVVVRVARR